ncbi:PAS domain-containing protein [Methylobacterium nigriterrae]|uniref:PAS domain-containing protein n=1 Tax=Methylobacterium nigriterrae TaxID=3127512 RepID=UPI003013DC7E
MLANAIDGAFEPLDRLRAALDASGVVGTWSWSRGPDRCILDQGAALILAGDGSLAGIPIPLEQARARVHPEDKDELLRQFRALGQAGGPLVAEYRAVSASGRVRTILDRGRISRDAAGGHGHGIILDVTESPRGEAGLPTFPDARRPLDLAAAHAIACRGEIDRLGLSELRLIVDMLLLRLGQELTRMPWNGEGLH